MKIKVCICETETDWKRELIEVELIKGEISIDSIVFEKVSYVNKFDVKRWADRGFDAYFKTEEKGALYEYDVFYIHTNLWLRFRFNWMFKRYWIQKGDNWKTVMYAIAGAIVFIVSTLISLGIIHK